MPFRVKETRGHIQVEGRSANIALQTTGSFENLCGYCDGPILVRIKENRCHMQGLCSWPVGRGCYRLGAI